MPDQTNDLYMWLGRIDANITALRDEIRAINTRVDSHESRIHALEIDSANRGSYVPRFLAVETDVNDIDSRVARIETTATVSAIFIKAMWAIGGAGVLAAAWWVIQAISKVP